MTCRHIPWGLIALLVCAAPSASTTVLPLAFDDIVARAETAFLGEAVRLRPDWRTTSRGKYIVTTVTFRTVRVLKGRVGAEVQLDFPGGEIGGLRMEVDQMPAFAVGDRDVLFLEGDRRVSPIVGFNNGRFRVIADRAGGPARVLMHDGRPFTAGSLPGAAARSLLRRPDGAMTYADFESLVLQTVAGSASVAR